MLSGRGICVGLITRPEESYRLWVCLNVIEESHRGGHGSLEAVAPWGNINVIVNSSYVVPVLEMWLCW